MENIKHFETEEDFDKSGEEVGQVGEGERWTLILRKGEPRPVEMVFTDFHEFSEGMSREERDKFAKKYTVEQFKIFLNGSSWMLNKLHPQIIELRDENQQLRQQIAGNVERDHMKTLMAKHQWGGKPNWSGIARVLDCDSKTAKARAKKLGLIR
jgi:hypothetical protein